MRVGACLFALSALIGPSAALAEGARMVLSCVDDTGAARSFAIDPIETDIAGTGRIAVDGAAGIAAGFLGPWAWHTEAHQVTLLIDGGPEAGRLPVLLHELGTATAPYTATLTRLSCEVPT